MYFDVFLVLSELFDRMGVLSEVLNVKLEEVNRIDLRNNEGESVIFLMEIVYSEIVVFDVSNEVLNMEIF